MRKQIATQCPKCKRYDIGCGFDDDSREFINECPDEYVIKLNYCGPCKDTILRNSGFKTDGLGKVLE